MTEEQIPSDNPETPMEKFMRENPDLPMGRMKESNFKKMARRDVRIMQKRMQYIARNPRGKDDNGVYMNDQDIVEVLQCNEALFVILSRLLKL